jgi:hypothetical protein
MESSKGRALVINVGNADRNSHSRTGWWLDTVIIIISLLMSPLLGDRPSLWITHKENHRGHKPLCGPSAG